MVQTIVIKAHNTKCLRKTVLWLSSSCLLTDGRKWQHQQEIIFGGLNFT